MKVMTDNTELIQEIQRLYLEGKKRREICNILGLKDKMVSYIIYQKLHLHISHPRRKNKVNKLPDIPKEKINKIINLAYWGYHPNEIAEDQAVNHNQVFTVIQYAKNKGII